MFIASEYGKMISEDLSIDKNSDHDLHEEYRRFQFFMIFNRILVFRWVSFSARGELQIISFDEVRVRLYTFYFGCKMCSCVLIF